MKESFLLTRLLLRFDDRTAELPADLSAVALTPDGNLWVGSDESLTIERLSPVAPATFGKHQSFFIGDFAELYDQKTEIDIEGLAYVDHYLWLTGSHSVKRKKVTGKDPQKDIERLTTIETELNRYLLMRIPVVNGELAESCSHPDSSDRQLTAACLQRTKKDNVLMDALKDDQHLGLFLDFPLPGKENGFDIEGFAIHPEEQGDSTRVFLGLRGPVLRGWAMMIELELEEQKQGVLSLKNIGEQDQSYKKHFLDLNGMGIRELCVHGGDLIILAGPTMALEGAMRVFRLRDMPGNSKTTIHSQESGAVEVLFDLPFRFGTDHAEGMTIVPCFGEEALLVVYDSPDNSRRPEPNTVFADVFRL